MDLETANKARDLLIRVQMLESRVGTLKSTLSDGKSYTQILELISDRKTERYPSPLRL